MISNLLVNANEIERWAERLDARGQMPRLVRRLIQATAPQIERLRFAADEGIQLGGWDGIVHASQGESFVPDGVSVWEMGTSQDCKGKADEDYEKRTSNPLDVDPKNTTFVFVTPRSWTRKDNWVKSRIEERVWSDVRAYDAHDIETWLEQAPAVHLWLSMLMGKRPQGAQSLHDYWVDWAAKTNPAFSPSLVIGGRQMSNALVEKWLKGEPAALALRGESSEEALAFLCAVIAAQEAPERERWFSRAIVVEDSCSWRALNSSTRLILAPHFEGEINGISRAVSNGNHVFIAGECVGARRADCLPRLARDAAETALQEMGISRDRARDLATLARRSLPALRRKIASEPTIKRPAWSQPDVARQLLPAVLAGSWQDANLADRDILSRLAGISYDQLQDILVRWSKAPDPPVRLVGGIWMCAAPEDAWILLSPFLRADNISLYMEVAIEALSAPSTPQTHIVVRISVAASDNAPQISGTLREGLSSTLALMTALSSEVAFTSGGPGDEVARNVVWSLFDKAKGSASFWATLGPQLPLLAEAAPGPFLDAVDAGLAYQEPFLRQMFYDEDSNNGFGPTSPHTFLLWALETLTWAGEYFGRAVLALARLTRIDPGGRNGNRASSSLNEIFVLWYPNTTVSLTRRLDVLDLIRNRESSVAWNLMMHILPTMHSATCRHPHGPKWHDWVPDKERLIPRGELANAVEAIVERLLIDAAQDASRWCGLIGRSGDLWPHLRERLLDKLEALDPDCMTSVERADMTESMRSIVFRHRECSDADWAMPETHLARLESLEQSFAPTDIVIRHAWRFERFVALPHRREMDWAEREKAISELRIGGIEKILQAYGWEGVLRLVSIAKDAESVGLALSSMSEFPGNVDVFLTENLASPDLSLAAAALGLVRGRAWRNDEAWLRDRLEAARNVWHPVQLGEFYLPFPMTESTLDDLDALSEPAQLHFWSRTQSTGLFKERPNAERVIERLIWAGRAAEAMRSIHWALHSDPELISADRIIEVMEAAISQSLVEWLLETRHDSAELLEHLSKTNVPSERLAGLEWLYFPFHKHDHRPKVLHNELARDPAFFMEVLSAVFRARPGETETTEREGELSPEPEPDAEEANLKAHIAEQGWALLYEWHQLPGIGQDGTVDANHLRYWVAKSRELAKEQQRSVIALTYIGHALAHSPRDEDGGWPHRAVREIIEEIANPHLESGFHCQVINNRGVTVRGQTDGGAQERLLVDRYNEDATILADRWPRTASLMRDIARSYQRDAEREDRSAELTQDFWR